MKEMINTGNDKLGEISRFDVNIANTMLEEARRQVNFEKYSPSDDKHLIILGGQPASGKSSIIEKISKEYGNNIICLNGDEFKPLFPNYEQLARENPDQTSKMVQPYSNYVVDNLKQEAIDKGLNTLIEGTMRTSKAPLETIEMFTNNGYTAEAYVVSSNYFNSRIGIEQRYEDEFAKQGFGRMVNPLNHNEAYHNIPNTLQELVNSGKLANITVATREAEILAETAKGDDIVKAYTNHRDNLTPEIYLDVAERIHAVNEMKMARRATQPELDNLTSIKTNLDNAFDKVFCWGSWFQNCYQQKLFCLIGT
jgi:UDP-N-acetylglucosamine kinase